MTVDLARRLVAAGVVQREEVQRALYVCATQNVHFLRALLAGGAVSVKTVEDELARADVPTLRTVVPILRLVEALPRPMCRSLLALPVRQDAMTGTVDVASVDPFNRHIEREFSHHLRAPIRLIRVAYSAMDEALRRLEGEPEQTAAIPLSRVSRRTPPYLSREELLGAASAGMPQLKQSGEIPIPLVRRAHSTPPAIPDTSPLGTATPQAPTPSISTPTPSSSTAPLSGPPSSQAPAGPFPDSSSALSAMRDQRTRDDVLALLIRSLEPLARRVGVFAVRKGGYHGYRCNEAFAIEAAFREVMVPGALPSVLATASTTGMYLGPMPRTHAHAALHGLLGTIGGEVAAAPIKVEGRLALVVLIDEIGDTMLATKLLEDLGRVAGDVLGRILQRDKQG